MFKKIFIIDDDEISIFLTESILQMEGFAEEVIGITSAGEALQKIISGLKEPRELPELVFLDLNMPFMSGWEFLEALNPYQQQLLNRCYFYILTSAVDESEWIRSRHHNLVSGLLQKPLTDSDIARIKVELGYE